jgi:hypothetical protein
MALVRQRKSDKSTQNHLMSGNATYQMELASRCLTEE